MKWARTKPGAFMLTLPAGGVRVDSLGGYPITDGRGPRVVRGPWSFSVLTEDDPLFAASSVEECVSEVAN